MAVKLSLMEEEEDISGLPRTRASEMFKGTAVASGVDPSGVRRSMRLTSKGESQVAETPPSQPQYQGIVQKFVPSAENIVRAATEARRAEQTASAAAPKDSGYRSLIPSTFETDPQRKASILRMAAINGRVPDGTDLPDWNDPALRKAMMQSDPIGSRRIFEGLDARLSEASMGLEKLASENPELYTSREQWRAAARQAIGLSPAFGKYADKLIEDMTPASVKAWETASADAKRLAMGQGILAEQKRKEIATDYTASTGKISEITGERFAKWFSMRGDLASKKSGENEKIVAYIKTGDGSFLTEAQKKLADRAKAEFDKEQVTRLVHAAGGGVEEKEIPIAERMALAEKLKAERNGGMATDFRNLSKSSTAAVQQEAARLRGKAATDPSAAEVVARADQEAARVREHSKNIGAPEWAASVAINMSGLDAAKFSTSYADEVLGAKGDFKAPVGVQIRPETTRKVEDAVRRAMADGRGFDDAALRKDLADAVSGIQNEDARRAALSEGLETAITKLRGDAQSELETAQTNWIKANSASLDIEMNQTLYEAADWIQKVAVDPSAQLGAELRGITDYAAVIAKKQGSDSDAPVEPWLVLASMGEKLNSEKFMDSPDGRMLVNSQWGAGMTRQGWDEWARQNRTTANYVTMIADQLNGARKIKEAETAKKYFAMQNNGSTEGFDPITGKGMDLFENFKRRGGMVIEPTGDNEEPTFLRSALTDDPDAIRSVEEQNNRISAFIKDQNVPTERKQQFWAALAGTGVKANEGRGQYDRTMAGLIIDGFTGTVDGAIAVGLANEQAYRNFDAKQAKLLNKAAKEGEPRYKPLTSDMAGHGYVSAKAQEIWALGSKTGDAGLLKASYNLMKVEQRLQIVNDIETVSSANISRPALLLVNDAFGIRAETDDVSKNLETILDRFKNSDDWRTVWNNPDLNIKVSQLLDARDAMKGSLLVDDDGGLRARLKESHAGFDGADVNQEMESVERIIALLDQIDEYRLGDRSVVLDEQGLRYKRTGAPVPTPVLVPRAVR